MERALAALNAQEHPSFEIVVVDNDSSDRTADVVRQSGARYLHAHSAFGIGACRRFAVEGARGEIVAFCDDDCVPEPGWIAAFEREFARRPTLALAGGQVINVGFAAEKEYKGLSRHLANGKCTFVNDPESAEYFGNMNLGLRRSAVLAVGNYDPSMNVMEELDLAERLRRAGYGVDYCPDAVLEHHHTGVSYKRRQRLRGPEWNRLSFFFAYHRPRSTRAWIRFARVETGLLAKDLRRSLRHLASRLRQKDPSGAMASLLRTASAVLARLSIPWILIRAATRAELTTRASEP